MRLALFTVLVAAFALRVFGFNWDDNQILHPDELFVAQVSYARVTLPRPIDWSNLADPHHSTLNPRADDADGNHQSFAYGTLPLYATDLVAEALNQLRAVPLVDRVMPGGADRDWHDLNQIWKVGRSLNMILDLAVVLLVFLIGQRVAGPIAGLVAAIIYACTPMVIQLAHFYTTDTWLVFGVALTIWASVRAAESGSRQAFILAGLAAGLAAATKPTGFATVGIVAIALLYDAWLRARTGYPPTRWTAELAERLALAGLAAVVLFAVTEPYVVLDPASYLADLHEQTSIQRGTFDVPYTRVYVGTQPLIYQAGQLIRWGMGPAGGILGLLGIVALAWRGWRRRGAAEIVTLGWIGIFVLTILLPQTKFLRYEAPVVPALAVGGGFLASRLLRLRLPRFSRTVMVSAATAFLILLVYWVTATTAIYAHPNTRISASEWIYANVPPGSSLTTEVWDRGVPLDLSPLLSAETYQYQWQSLDSYDDRPQYRDLVAVADALDTAPLTRPAADAIRRDDFAGANQRLASVATAIAALPDDQRSALAARLAVAETTIGPTAGDLRVDTSDLERALNGDQGAPDTATAVGTLAATIETTGENEPATAIYDQLQASDYYVVSSNRITESLPHLPWRYPVQIAFFGALQRGELGYTLVASFEQHPGALGLSFNDDGADESWINYDHPHVLIYQKTDLIPRDQFDALLAPERNQPVSPTRAAPTDHLMLDQPDGDLPVVGDARWSSSLTHVPGVALLFWVAMLAVLQIAGLPLARLVLGTMADGGWVFARLLVTVTAAFVVWLGASTHLFLFRAVWCGLALIAIGLLTWAVRWRWRPERFAAAARPEQRRVAGIGEVVFWSVFALFLVFRFYNPDSWHTVWGGEKPMEFAHLNAILRSPQMPPVDPWYSGAYINYYYYGTYLVAFLIKLTGIPAEIAFNLAQPTMMAFLAAGAYGVAATLGRDLTRRAGGRRGAAILAGLLGTVLVVLVGNLVGFFNLIDRPAGDDWQVRVWGPSRALGNTTITEFPFFSGLYADLHAHVAALPITTLIIAVAYALASQPRVLQLAFASRRGVGWWRAEFIVRLVVLGLLLGTLYMANAWDMATYVLLSGFALLMATRALGGWAVRVAATVGLGIVLAIVTVVVMLPFYLKYVALFHSLGRVKEADSFWQVASHFGGLALIVVSGLIALLTVDARATWRSWLQPLLPVLAVVVLLAVAALFSSGRASSSGRLDGSDVAALGIVVVLALLLAAVAWSRGASLGGPLPMQALRAAVAVVGLIVSIGAAIVGQPVFGIGAAICIAGAWTFLFVPGAGPRFVGLMVAAAGGIVAAMEVVYLVDNLHATSAYRMNTVFKFYNQVWVLLALAGAALVARAFMVARYAQLADVERSIEPTREDRVRGGGVPGIYPVATPAQVATVPTVASPQVERATPEAGPDAAHERAMAHPAVRSTPRLARRSEIRPQELPPALNWSRVATVIAVIVIVLSAVYPVTAAPVRLNNRFAGTPDTLNAYEWMNFARIGNVEGSCLDAPTATDYLDFRDDLAAINWFNDHVHGTPVIAEASIGTYRCDGSRFSISTGLPTIIGWDYHESQQRDNPDLGTRVSDVHTLYDTPDVEQKLSILRQYDVQYVIVGSIERHLVVVSTVGGVTRVTPYASAEGIAAFDSMVGTSLEVAYQHGETTIYRVMPAASAPAGS